MPRIIAASLSIASVSGQSASSAASSGWTQSVRALSASATIAAAKWLPAQVQDLESWHEAIYYAVFFAAIGWAFLRGPAQGACELLWLCAGVTLLVPVTSLAGVWGIGGAWNHARGWPVDLTALAAAPVFVLLAWHTRRRMLQGHADSVWAGAATTTTSSPRLPADSGAGT